MPEELLSIKITINKSNISFLKENCLF